MSDLDRKRAVQATKSAIWSQCIRAGREAQRTYRQRAAEVLSYFQTDRTGLFERIRETYLNLDEGGTPIRVNLASLMRSVMAPYLYQRNPRREVTSLHPDAVKIGEARLLEEYLNYTAREGKIAPEIRAMVDDGLIRGRGFLRPYFDNELGIFTSQAVPSIDVLIDPAVLRLRDADWIAIRSRLPLWRVRQIYGAEEKWRVEGLKPGIRVMAGEPDEEPDERDATKLGYMDDQVELWEVYSKRGNGLTRGPFAVQPGTEFANDDDSNEFVKITLVLDHPVLLEEGEWDAPIYLDREWPIVAFDPVPTPGKLWPESIMSQAMVHQKAIDVLSTLEFEAAKIHARDLYFYRGDCLTADDVKRLLHGAPGEAIAVSNLPAGLTPKDVIFRPDLGQQAPELRMLCEKHQQMFEMISGVLPVLQGGVDQTSADRSATASAQKTRAAQTRTGDLLTRVEEACTDAARIEAMMLRLSGLVTPQEVARVIGDKVDFGYRVETTPPIRLRGGSFSLEKIAPFAATYFNTAEQVEAILLQVWQAIEAAASPMQPGPPQPELVSLYATLSLGGMSPDGVPLGMVARKVTTIDVLKDTAGRSPKEFVREYSFEIATGSTQRQDPQTKREHADKLIQQVLPIAMKLGDYAAVNMVLRHADDAYGVPVDERAPPLKPPPPPPPPAPAPPPGMGPSPGGGSPPAMLPGGLA